MWQGVCTVSVSQTLRFQFEASRFAAVYRDSSGTYSTTTFLRMESVFGRDVSPRNLISWAEGNQDAIWTDPDFLPRR